VKAEARDVAVRTHRPAAICRPDGARRVFDDRHARRQRRQSIEIRRQTDLVDRHDRLGSGRYAAGASCGSMFHVPADVGKNRRRADGQRRVGGRDERLRGQMTRRPVRRRQG
jgi:hypothetical protein